MQLIIFTWTSKVHVYSLFFCFSSSWKFLFLPRKCIEKWKQKEKKPKTYSKHYNLQYSKHNYHFSFPNCLFIFCLQLRNQNANKENLQYHKEIIVPSPSGISWAFDPNPPWNLQYLLWGGGYGYFLELHIMRVLKIICFVLILGCIALACFLF